MEPNRTKQCVVLCEPQCRGFEHATFNAALLRTVCLAYPADRVVFFGEKTHCECVRDDLTHVLDVERIDFRQADIPSPRSSNLRRLPQELRLCRWVLDETLREKAQALLFCSITNTGLLSLKLLMPMTRFRVPTAAIAHSCVATIAGPQARRPWNWIVGLRRVLLLPHPQSLRLVVLGNSILANVKKSLPRCPSQWSSLDLVYSWPSHPTAAQPQSHSLSRPLRFGYLGVVSWAGNKGFAGFCQLAEEIAVSPQIAEFTVAGFYPGPAAQKPFCRHIPDIPDQPLTRQEFEKRARQITYVVSTANSAHYRLTASATFLDALAFLKPGIYLRNEYVEHYFDRLGDIGYLCDSHEEMVATIREIISAFPASRYASQVENIRKGRHIFEPETLAPQLRAILESSEREFFPV